MKKENQLKRAKRILSKMQYDFVLGNTGHSMKVGGEPVYSIGRDALYTQHDKNIIVKWDFEDLSAKDVDELDYICDTIKYSMHLIPSKTTHKKIKSIAAGETFEMYSHFDFNKLNGIEKSLIAANFNYGITLHLNNEVCVYVMVTPLNCAEVAEIFASHR